MRYILIILVFCSVGAKAQMVIKAHANYRPYALPAANLLLDDYPNASVAYSLRKLDKDYAGNCIRVRRSNDNAESDIGFTSGGDLDTATLKTFVGANNGFVVTWYDQSGNALNLSQSSASNQPKIINSGTIIRAEGKVIIEFFPSNLQYIENSTISAGNIKTIFTVYKKGSLQANEEVFFDSRITSQSVVYKENNINGDRLNIAFGTNQRSNYTFANGDFKLLTIIQDGANGNAYINASSIYASNVNFGANSFNGLRLGAVRGTASLYLNAGLYEFIIYGSNQSSNRTGIENNINDYYNLYWNGDFTGLLDTYGSSAAAYSLRNLSSTYTGPLIRVRRSNDNAEQDIYGDYYGNLDTASLKTFVGANSGFVTTWYDQSGNGSNATQSTAANQPRIMNAGVVERVNTKPAVLYDGTNDRFVTGITNIDLTNGDNLSAFNVVRPSNVSNFLTILSKAERTGGAATEDGWDFRINNTSRVQFGAWKDESYTTAISTTNETANVQRLLSCFANGGTLTTNINIFGNGTEFGYTRTGTTTTLDNTTYVVNIGAQMYVGAAYFHWNGSMQEIILYNADKRTDRTGIEGNINTHYSIY